MGYRSRFCASVGGMRASVPMIHSVRAHERALISSSCLQPSTQRRCRGEVTTSSMDCATLVARPGHLLTTRISRYTQRRHFSSTPSLGGGRARVDSFDLRLSAPVARPGPDDRLCHRRAANGRAVLGGSSVAARVREGRGARSTFCNANDPTILMQRAAHGPAAPTAFCFR